MSKTDRRTMLQMLSAAPVAAGLVWTDAEARQAHAAQTTAKRTATPFKPKFFTAHEYATVRLLVDLIIPKDERSGSATDAAVPEFMDFMMVDQPNRQTAMRGGLAWIDAESQRRFDRLFAAASEDQRRAILDDISWPTRVPRGMTYGSTFFASFRDLTASGFWTTKMGIEDLGYMGNTSAPNWTGCPEPALRKLGLEPGRE